MSCHLSMWANIPLHNFLYLTVLNNVFFFSFCVIALTSSRFGYPFKLPPFSPQCHVCVKLSRLSFLIMCPKYFFCLFLLLCISPPPPKEAKKAKEWKIGNCPNKSPRKVIWGLSRHLVVITIVEKFAVWPKVFCFCLMCPFKALAIIALHYFLFLTVNVSLFDVAPTHRSL